jgi:hypothetical protein
MKFDDFTKEERTIIAEFVYSFDSDILIKSDALDLVDLFIKKELVDNPHGEELRNKINNNLLVIDDLIEILFTSVEEQEGRKIMQEYFGDANKYLKQ